MNKVQCTKIEWWMMVCMYIGGANCGEGEFQEGPTWVWDGVEFYWWIENVQA
jgi:hypothetical protein